MFAAPTRFQSQLSALLVLLLITSFGLVGSASAQDEGRYRPQGRQIGTAVGREFREQVYEVRIYDPQPAVAQFSKATIFYPLTLSFAPPYGAVVLVPADGSKHQREHEQSKQGRARACRFREHLRCASRELQRCPYEQKKSAPTRARGGLVSSPPPFPRAPPYTRSP